MNKKIHFASQFLIFLLLFLYNTTLLSAPLPEEGNEQDTVEQKRKGLIFFPILFYTPETKIAAGGLVNYYFRESKSKITSRPSSIMPSVIYTQNKQILAELSTYLYWMDEKYYLESYVAHIKFPDKFYGIGNNTSEDDEEDYTPRFVRFKISFQKKIPPGLYLGMKYQLERSKLTEVEKDGLLAKGDILGSKGGVSSGAGLLASWDTRNSVYCPSRGGFHQLSATFFKSAVGSDYDFNRYTFDFRQYLALFSSHVLAFQGYLNAIAGDPSFQMLSLLGGIRMMRGYYEGRYRDKNMIIFQADYRMPVWKRFGMVGFAGLGDVADKVSKFSLGNFKYSFGCGIRYQLSPEEKNNLRLDFGFGEGSSGLYITLKEAF